MTRVEIRAQMRGRDRCLGVADTPEDAERVQAAFAAALRRPVRLVPVEQRPVAGWRAEAA
ncbi:hypothetical protein [Micromonospora sp. NPDC047730]|uniref:hypothetical protein n=1 Tax=Micromonospora sp. NPDC047730 TaxID=3364253 RepID=UPI00371D9ADE